MSENYQKHDVFISYSTKNGEIANKENYYRAIDLRSNKNGGVIDALSTAIFSIEDINQIKEIINNIEEFYNMKIDYCLLKDDYSLTMSKGFNDTLIDPYTSNKINEIIIQ